MVRIINKKSLEERISFLDSHGILPERGEDAKTFVERGYSILKATKNKKDLIEFEKVRKIFIEKKLLEKKIEARTYLFEDDVLLRIKYPQLSYDRIYTEFKDKYKIDAKWIPVILVDKEIKINRTTILEGKAYYYPSKFPAILISSPYSIKPRHFKEILFHELVHVIDFISNLNAKFSEKKNKKLSKIAETIDEIKAELLSKKYFGLLRTLYLLISQIKKQEDFSLRDLFIENQWKIWSYFKKEDLPLLIRLSIGEILLYLKDKLWKRGRLRKKLEMEKDTRSRLLLKYIY